MANEETKKLTTQEMVDVAAAQSAGIAIAGLQAIVDEFPRTDGMTLPSVMITEIDEETVARMSAISAVNHAVDPETVIDENGKTLQQVRNEFAYGVADLNDEGPKHQLEIVNEDGKIGVKVIAPEIEGEQQAPVTIVATPANVAPVDAGIVEAKEQGLIAPTESGVNNPTPTPAPEQPTPTLRRNGTVVEGTTTASPTVSPSAPSTSGEGGTETTKTGDKS